MRERRRDGETTASERQNVSCLSTLNDHFDILRLGHLRYLYTFSRIEGEAGDRRRAYVFKLFFDTCSNIFILTIHINVKHNLEMCLSDF